MLSSAAEQDDPAHADQDHAEHHQGAGSPSCGARRVPSSTATGGAVPGLVVVVVSSVSGMTSVMSLVTSSGCCSRRDHPYRRSRRPRW